MAAIEDTAAMIDYLELQYGQEVEIAADARANLLMWLQAAETEIYALAPWHWKQEETTNFTFALSTQKYTMDDTYQDILMIKNANGDVMQKVPWPIFHRLYTSLDVNTVAGMPTRWTWYPRAAASPNALQIGIWPIPSETPGHTTTTIIREKKAQTLTDTSSSYSFVPYNFRPILYLRAMRNLAVHEGKANLLQILEKDIETFKNALAGKERDFVQGLI